jgi:formiminotetrahydrofolate cyclodeaminase
MLNKTCYEFIDALASKAPIPGGGGASALAASIGVALGCMVGNLTIGKKKYADVEEDILELLRKSKALIDRTNKLVQDDAEVFEPLSKAYSLPSETEQQRINKEKTLQKALIRATIVPLEITECASCTALQVVFQFLGNPAAPRY